MYGIVTNCLNMTILCIKPVLVEDLKPEQHACFPTLMICLKSNKFVTVQTYVQGQMIKTTLLPEAV